MWQRLLLSVILGIVLAVCILMGITRAAQHATTDPRSSADGQPDHQRLQGISSNPSVSLSSVGAA